MKKYGWQAVYLSFFSGDLYRDVARNWRGVGYLYLLFVSLGVSAVLAIAAQIACNTMIATSVEPFIAKWPALAIKDGKFSIDKESPYVIELQDNYIVDFDTTPDAKFPEGKRGWFVGEDTVKQYGLSTGDDEKEVVALSSLGKQAPMVIDQKALLMYVGIMKSCVGVFVFIFQTIALVVLGMLQSLIYGLVGMLIANAMKINLTYGTCVRLAVVALTPGILIDSIGKLSMHPIPLFGLISVVIAIGYLVFALKANQKPDLAEGPTVVEA